MRRVTVLVLATLAAWLGLATPTAVAAMPTAVPIAHVHDCDGYHATAVCFETATERGPPATSHNSAYNADGLRSRGASPRPNAAGTRAIYDYDDLAQLVQIPPGRRDAQEEVGGVEPFPVVVERACVAANAGPRALPVGPWGQKIVDARTRLPSSWGPGTPNAKGVGTRWFDPANKGNGIRIDQGIPGSSYASQQVDHVVVRSGGRILGPDGKPIVGPLSQNPQAHIPLSDWLTWSSWSTP